MQPKVLMTSIFFVFVFLFGLWLSRSDKPYNSLFFNIYKLIGLAMGMFLIVIVYQVQYAVSLSPVEILAIVKKFFVFIILVAAGGLLNIQATGDLENASQSILVTISVISKVSRTWLYSLPLGPSTGCYSIRVRNSAMNS